MKINLGYLLDTVEGREILDNMLELTGFYDEQSHVMGDPHTTAFISGRRSIGTTLFKQVLTQRPESITLIMSERAARIQVEEHNARTERDRADFDDDVFGSTDEPEYYDELRSSAGFLVPAEERD